MPPVLCNNRFLRGWALRPTGLIGAVLLEANDERQVPQRGRQTGAVAEPMVPPTGAMST